MTGGTHPFDDLKAYCDGELTLTRRLSVRLHLARCASCREEIQFMQQLGNDLRPAGAATLDPDLRERVLTEAANTPLSTSLAPEPTTRRRISPLIFALGSGLTVLVLAAILFPIFAKAREKARSIVGTSAPAESPIAEGQVEKYSYDAKAKVPEQELAHIAAKPEVIARQSAGVAVAPVSPSPMAREDMAVPPSPPPLLNDVGEDPLRRVHKEANLTVQVTDPEEKSDEVAQITRDIGGYVGSNNLSTDGDGTKTADIVVNLPEPQFEAFVANVAKLGTVTAKQITGEDITQKVSDADQAEQVLDDEAQRAQARLQMLGRHSKWDDVEQARDLRIQLAQARARLQLLKKMGTLSTVTIDLTEKPKPPTPVQTGFLPGLHDTSQQALQSLGASLGILMSLAIWVLAYAPIWTPGLFDWPMGVSKVLSTTGQFKYARMIESLASLMPGFLYVTVVLYHGIFCPYGGPCDYIFGNGAGRRGNAARPGGNEQPSWKRPV